MWGFRKTGNTSAREGKAHLFSSTQQYKENKVIIHLLKLNRLKPVEKVEQNRAGIFKEVLLFLNAS